MDSKYIAVGVILFVLLLSVIVSLYIKMYKKHTPPVDEFVVEVRLVVAHGHAVSSDQVVTETVKDPKQTLLPTLKRLCETAYNPNSPGTESGPGLNINVFRFEIRHVTKKHSKHALQFAVRKPNAIGTKLINVEYDKFKPFSYHPDDLEEMDLKVVHGY
jgi:hypothetical protein